jgi:hypothetical protein
MVRQGGLEFHRERVQELVASGLDPMDIASALMVLVGPARPPDHQGGQRSGKRRRRH